MKRLDIGGTGLVLYSPRRFEIIGLLSFTISATRESHVKIQARAKSAEIYSDSFFGLQPLQLSETSCLKKRL